MYKFVIHGIPKMEKFYNLLKQMHPSTLTTRCMVSQIENVPPEQSL